MVIRIVADGVRYRATDIPIHNTEILTPELKVFFQNALNLTGAKTYPPQVNSSGSPGTRTNPMCWPNTYSPGIIYGRPNGWAYLTPKWLTLQFGQTGEIFLLSETAGLSRPAQIPAVKICNRKWGLRVEANAATEINKLPFTRVKVKFIERMMGNLHRREAHLRHRVKIAFAPVHNLDEKLDLELIPAEKMPPDSRTLQAEAVDIIAIPGTDGESFSITAVGNATLESLEISGDARQNYI